MSKDIIETIKIVLHIIWALILLASFLIGGYIVARYGNGAAQFGTILTLVSALWISELNKTHE